MLRVLVIVVALMGVAHAQMDLSANPQRDARNLTEETLARYDSEIASRNPLLRLYDLFDDALISNAKYARKHFDEAKEAFDKVPKGDEADLQDKLREMKQQAKAVNRTIDAYKVEAKGTMLKMVGGLVLIGLFIFGGAIWAVIKAKAARRPMMRR